MAAAFALLPQLVFGNYVGIAKQPDSDRTHYREIHCVNPAGDKAKPQNGPSEIVHYVDNSGNTIATKRLNGGFEFVSATSENPATRSVPSGINPAWVPQYEFIHHRFGMAEGLVYEEDSILLKRREGSEADTEKKTISVKKKGNPLIADAGFDAFIRDHLDAFIQGKSKNVTYLSAPRLSTLNFTLEPVSVTAETVTLSMYPQNFVIRLLVDNITVVYDRQSARLLSFQGLTNVPESPEENFIAMIQYQYEEDLDALCE